MTDFSQYKFRASGVGDLLVDARSKEELLSETAKTYLKKLWILEVYHREEYITSKYMEKGIAVESDSLDLLSKAENKSYFKNQKRFENEYLTGTPDVIEKDFIIDIKSSWSIWTFAAIDERKAKSTYYGQVLSYMILTGRNKARLAYVLANTPEEQIEYEMYKLKVSGAIKDTEEEVTKARSNFVFDDIPAEKRLKTYEFERDAEIETKLIERIKVAREYMSNLSL